MKTEGSRLFLDCVHVLYPYVGVCGWQGGTVVAMLGRVLVPELRQEKKCASLFYFERFWA